MSFAHILVTGLLFSLSLANRFDNNQGGYYMNRPYYLSNEVVDMNGGDDQPADLEEEEPNDNHPNYYISRYLLKRNADILNDPRFLNCIGQLDIVNNPGMALPAYARCASLMGRPRFGKRSKPVGLASMMKVSRSNSLDFN